MMHAVYVRIISFFFLLFTAPSYSQTVPPSSIKKETTLVKYYQVQDRYVYGEKLLELALSKLDSPFMLDAPAKQIMNEARGDLEIVSGDIDIQWVSTTTERETKMIPIKVPIYRGMLGLRLSLIHI